MKEPHVLMVLMANEWWCFFLQVQLLVSEEDVENYKKIKASLDQLRLTVEKSELWVEKSGGYGNEDISENQNKEQNLEVCTYWKKHLAYC